MLTTEFKNKLPHLCKYPFTGCMINASGNIGLCCHAPNAMGVSLSNIEDLEATYNDNSYFESIRKQFDTNTWDQIKECSICYDKEKIGIPSGRNHFNSNETIKTSFFEKEWSEWKSKKRRQLRFLELATSNICNQQCATCSSFFSTRWHSLDRKFGRPVHEKQELSRENLEKLIRILHGLKALVLKGGEPFADPKNLRILQALVECNEKCWLSIVSNMKHIAPSWYESLSRCKRLFLGASIDGVDEVYGWIRGSDFDGTLKTIQEYYEITNRRVSINTCLTIYNLFSISDLIERFIEHPAISRINLTNITYYPSHVSIVSLPPKVTQKALKQLVTQIESIKKNYPDTHVEVDTQQLKNFISSRAAWSVNNTESTIRAATELKRMNEVRGTDICDLTPELREAFNSCGLDLV